VLTDTGLLRLRQAWPAHLASVRRHILDHLQAFDIPALAAALQRLAAETPYPQPHRQHDQA
jgi:hypothetical protein